jgi:hypothetical protein
MADNIFIGVSDPVFLAGFFMEKGGDINDR